MAVTAGLGISTIQQVVSMAKKIVGHFRHSVIATKGLEEKQISLNIPKHKLLQEICTRWNSTFFMCERLLEQRWAIYTVIHDELITKADNRHLDLKPHQWDVLTQLVTVLKPLQVATTALCEEQNVSVSLIYPVLNGLITKHLALNEDDLPAIRNFKDTVKKELIRRFDVNTPNLDSVPIIAAALDPHYHGLK